MKKIKLVSLISAVLALAVLTSACGGGGKVETSSHSAAEVSGVNEFPIVKEPVTLSVFTSKPTTLEDLETNEFTKWYEEKTNVKIDWNYVSGNTRQSINLQIASRDFADIFLGFNFARAEQTSYYEQDVFIDMTDLVDKHSYYIKEMFKNNPEVEKEIRHTENKILGLPSGVQDFSSATQYKLWVYEPWMKKLGAKMPETTEELYELLKRFKEEDPNGNGKADEIPLAGRNMRGNPVGLDMFIMNAFTEWTRFGFYNDNGTAKFCAITDGAKEGIKFMHKLYKEGLIHPDSFSMDRSRMTALAENDVPILGMAPGMWTTQFTLAGAPSGRMNEFVAITPLKGPGGVQQTMDDGLDAGCTAFSITSNCKNPEAAIKWVDWFYSEEGYLKGYAADGMRKATEGELGLDGTQAIYTLDEVGATDIGTVQNKRWITFAPCFVPLEGSIKVKNNTIDAIRQANAYDAHKRYEPYLTDGVAFIDFPVPSEDSEDYLELRSTITSAIDSGFVGFVIGEKDIEKDWDAYVQNFYNLGLERYLEIVQNYLDAQK